MLVTKKSRVVLLQTSVEQQTSFARHTNGHRGAKRGCVFSQCASAQSNPPGDIESDARLWEVVITRNSLIYIHDVTSRIIATDYKILMLCLSNPPPPRTGFSSKRSTRRAVLLSFASKSCAPDRIGSSMCHRFEWFCPNSAEILARVLHLVHFPDDSTAYTARDEACNKLVHLSVNSTTAGKTNKCRTTGP